MAVNWSDAALPGWQILELAGRRTTELFAARHWVETRLATLSETDRVDTLLVVNELLENAHHHAGGPIQLRLQLQRKPCTVTVAVADHSARVPRIRVPGHDGGRGLLLVDQICSTWGVSHHDDGKLVWGRLRCVDLRLHPSKDGGNGPR